MRLLSLPPLFAVALSVFSAALTTAGSGVRKVHSNYYLPISNTATGVMALETLE